MSPTQANFAPIAIIGIGLRLPGGISTPDAFWDQLINKKDGKCRVPSDRYNIDAFHGDKVKQQNVATEYGYFLDHVNLKSFDASFFAAKRAEVEVTDPQQRLLLEVVWECMESAGQSGLRGTNTGVYVGVFGEDWHNILHRDEQVYTAYRVLSAGDYALANRLSYEFDLRGPSMTIRTACSASLSGLHLACQALQNGDCETAVVAGSSIIMEPSMTIDMSQQGVLSPTGSCKTFDAAADGFARGEAVNALLIKPLDKALRDGDPIRAVIRSTAVNSDGRTSHMGSPSTESQEALIRRAYQVAGIDDLAQTAFFECHGTGTAVGDPLEVAAVGNVFGSSGVYIGSVKPNVGHGEGASGITSVIKGVLALENNVLPPNINFTTPNPKIPFQKHKLVVPVEPVQWPEDRQQRVSVNSFGIGGANAHVILDSAESFGVSRQSEKRNGVTTCTNGADGDEGKKVEHEPVHNVMSEDSDKEHLDIPNGASGEVDPSTCNGSPDTNTRWPLLLPASANNTKSLQSRQEDLRQYIKSHPGRLNDLAYTLALRRRHFTHRSFCIVEDGPVESLEFSAPEKAAQAAAQEGSIAYVFTGQGAQWAGMARSLMHDSGPFRSDIREMDNVLQGLRQPPEWTIEGLLTSEGDDKDVISRAEFAQPLCTAIQIALVNFLKRCGVSPSAVVGHSSGEIAAAYATEILTTGEAILCAYLRGLVTKICSREGSMAAIGLGYQEVQSYLAEGAEIACENSPSSVTISGDSRAVGKTLEAINWKDGEIFARLLHVNVAYHSKHMKEAGETYETLLRPYLSQTPQPKPVVPLYSTVSGTLATPDTSFGSAYWRSNLESPVLFHGAVSRMLAEMPQVRTIIEVGPHAALQGPLRQIFKTKCSQNPPQYLPTLLRGNDGIRSVLNTLGQLYSRGYEVDFTIINPPGSLLHDLPSYPWDHNQEFWKESRVSEAWRLRKHAHHELLGSRCPESSHLEPVWRNIFHQSDIPWLRDHKVGTNVVFPCAAYIAMLGEAIRQVSGCEAYIIRNLTVKSALMLPEEETIEIMTTVRPARVTERTNSKNWHEMTISTFNGSLWVENCVAQGRAGSEGEEDGKRPTRDIFPQTRHISSGYFYDHMNYLGIRYGPRFQCLKDISADTETYLATASLSNDRAGQEADYPVHPTVIDSCLQLHGVTGCKGIARHMDTLILPVDIRRITVFSGGQDLLAEARLDPGDGTGSAVATDSRDNRVVLSLEDTKGVPFETGDRPEGKQPLDLGRLEWLPHIDYLAPEGLLKRGDSEREVHTLVDKITILGVLKTLNTIKSLEEEPTGHLAKYVSWLERERNKMAQGNREILIDEPKEWCPMSSDRWTDLMDTFMQQVEASGDAKALNVARMLHDASQELAVEAIFRGQTNPLEVMLEDDRLADLYWIQSRTVDASDFFRLCGHARPTMKILEIGAGTGGTTDRALSALVTKDGVRLYSQYVYTDVSPGFFSSAKGRFKDVKGLEYKTLDIEKNPAEQGFELGSFDLVIASNVLHATSSLKDSLYHVRSLLRPGGRLYLEELAKPLVRLTAPFLMGRLPGWWVGNEDGRADEPYITVQQWDEKLREAGFSGADTAVTDDDFPYWTCAHITSRAITNAGSPKPEAVVFLYKDCKVDFAQELASMFRAAGVDIHWQCIRDGEADRTVKHVISTIDLEGPFLDDISEGDYESFISFLSSLDGRGLLWLTRPAQTRCTDPRYGVVNGLSRTIRVELLVDFWTVELEDLTTASAEAASAISRQFWAREPLKHGVDAEFWVGQEGTVHVGRYHWTSLPSALESDLPKTDPKQLMIGQYGMLDSLRWVQQGQKLLGSDEVVLDIRCVGLNFKDVMAAMGLVPMPKDALGFEATGVVKQVGSAIDHVQAGDRVFAISTGLFTTRKVLPGRCVFKMPEALTFEQAATMPIVYATAIYALITLGQLRKGQSILIHSGTGGVGQAAIYISQMLGAEIFVTVGSVEKINYLVENHGIQRERIFDSHSTSFLDGVMNATGGRGVDVVLNSLSGELLHASWECVAKFGKMLEIGKRDILEHGRLALDLFHNNRTFYGIDLSELLLEQPDTIQSLIDQLLTLASENNIRPIHPIHTFPAQKISEAARFMKKGGHIGKIVITMPDEPADIPATKVNSGQLFSDTATYLVVGGLGGLGMSVTRWMVEKGARNFCFLSRSAGTQGKHRVFLEEIRSQGCQAVAVSGSVTDMADVQRAIETSPSGIAGVLQMSMVLRDLPVLKMGHADFRAAHDCKVKGTWNLHNALANTDLDFFILMSSISASVGHPGQANYSSANSFLDSFAQYRQGLGLPCSVINLGGMEGVGFLSQRPAKLNQYRSFGLYMLQEHHLVESIQLALKNRNVPPIDRAASESSSLSTAPFSNSNQFVIGLNTSKPLSDPTNRALYKGDIRVSLYDNIAPAEQGGGGGRDENIRDLLTQVEMDPQLLHEPDTLKRVSWEVGRTLFSFLLLPEEDLDVTMTLSSIGIDSLVSIEIRNWWRKMLGVDITVLQIMNAGTVEGLGKLAIASLKKKYGVNEEGDAEADVDEGGDGVSLEGNRQGRL